MKYDFFYGSFFAFLSHKNGIFAKIAVLFTFSKKLTFFFMYLRRKVFSTNWRMDFKNKEKMDKLWTKLGYQWSL